MSSQRRGFITGGCWVVDRNMTVPFWPDEDMSVPASASIQRGGGAACNFAIGMRKLDPSIPVETIGLVGADNEGRFLAELAKSFGVDCAKLQVTSNAATHTADAFQSIKSGRRTHIFHSGTSDLLSPDHFDFAAARGRLLHLGMPGICALMDGPWGQEPNGWVAVLKKARSAGIETNMELVTVPRQKLADLARPCLPYLDTLIVNDYEIGAIAQFQTTIDGTTDERACLAAARRTLEIGAMDAVVVHYVLGALLVARDGSEIRKASVNAPADKVQGTNGAGDAFAAGFLYARHEGWSYDRCLTLAHAAAATCLRSITTTDSIGTVRECLDLALDWGWRE